MRKLLSTKELSEIMGVKQATILKGLCLNGHYLDLQRAAQFAIERRTYLNPEFGLLIAASLVERFPNQTDGKMLVEHLSKTVLSRPQNLTVESVASILLNWLDKKDASLSVVIPNEWLTNHVVRPLPADSDIFLHRQEAEETVTRLLATDIFSATAEDFDLADQLIRIKASELLENWAEEALPNPRRRATKGRHTINLGCERRSAEERAAQQVHARRDGVSLLFSAPRMGNRN